ncbi:MAG TPA: glycoside hydrolase family 11 protein [Steroidobacteraceae bacterium]|nr:glycoside hydrolase family 11 protein [Steroidobacteraceae bacterium]
MKKLSTFLLLAFSLCWASGASAQICITSSSASDDIIGTQDGYRHELWTDQKKSPACMTLGTKAAFTANWGSSSSKIENYLARRGLGYDDTKKHYEIGSFNASYDVTYSPNCSSGNSYMGVYGWAYDSTKAIPNDLVEWYIIDNWCNYNPSKDPTAESLGTIYGGEYDVYRVKRVNKPSIKGTRDFMQYFSVRKNLRTSGLLNISHHFYAWEKLGMPLGNLHEVSMLVEGYQNYGTATFNSLDVYRTDEVYATKIDLVETAYNLKVGDLTSALVYTRTPAASTLMDVTVTSSNPSVVSIGNYKGNFFLQANSPGNATITISSLTAPRPGSAADTATVSVIAGASPPPSQKIEFRALGTIGTEKVNILLNGQPVGQQFSLTKDFQVYTDTIFGSGDLSIEFANDDGLQTNSRDVRLDYVSINGVKRETESMPINSARYVNGVCGGGGYSEWLNCNGAVNFGRIDPAHKIVVRARGNAGGEHVALLIDGQAVNGGWTLGTGFQEYTVTVNKVDGDINVRYDNDGGTKDAVIDWVKVDNQVPRQAENMSYNTGVFANGRCGGGTKSEWLHCNGVIGFGKISDNFN